jgi:hypothetical protein
MFSSEMPFADQRMMCARPATALDVVAWWIECGEG